MDKPLGSVTLVTVNTDVKRVHNLPLTLIHKHTHRHTHIQNQHTRSFPHKSTNLRSLEASVLQAFQLLLGIVKIGIHAVLLYCESFTLLHYSVKVFSESKFIFCFRRGAQA